MRIIAWGLTHPHLLPLLLAAFLPILLHILDRRRARVVDWPAVRFLVLGNQARLRRWRLMEALLILVRSLLALIVAAAALGPFVSEPRAVRRGAEGLRHVFLVLDTSLSMAHRGDGGGRRAWDAATEGALDILDTLRPGDRVGIVHTSAEGAVASRTADIEDARRQVRGLEPGGGRFHLIPSLDQVAPMIEELRLSAPGAHSEIYVLTDLQQDMLEGAQPERLRFMADRLRRGGVAPSLRIIDCGSTAPSNRFVASLDPDPLAACVGEPSAVRAVIEDSRTAAQQEGQAEAPMGSSVDGSVRVALLTNDVEVQAVEAALPAGGTRSVDFDPELRREGTIRISVKLPPDDLADDDSRYMAVVALDRIDVLVVGPSEDDGRAREAADHSRPRFAADYVRLALAPHAPGLESPAVAFRCDVSSDAHDVDFERYRVIVLAGLRTIEPGIESRLEPFVRSGRGLLAFAGSETDGTSWTERLYREGRGILPARLGTAPGSAPVALGPREIMFSHPALEVFSRPEEGDLSRVRVERWAHAALVAPESVVLARIDADSPWIIERPCGLGRAILITTSAAPGDGDLPLTPLFLPLVHRLVRYLAAGGSQESSVLLGEEIAAAIPADAGDVRATVHGPAGFRRDLELEAGSSGWIAAFRGAAAPGFYDIRVARPDGSPLLTRTFSVNVDPQESRLERAGSKAMESLRSELGVEVSRSAGEVASPFVVEEVEVELWPAAVAAALLLALLEILLSRTFTGGRSP